MNRDDTNKLAAWMIQRGYATGHGDTIENLLAELEWQIAERVAAERKRCINILKTTYIIDDGEDFVQIVLDRINHD